jgi:ribose transport system substrate-binding protein
VKQFRWVLVILAVAAVLSGCAAQAPAVAPVKSEAPVCPACPTCPEAAPCPAAESPNANLSGKTFYWLAANNSNAFYVPGLKGWEQAAKDFGVKAEFVGPNDPNLAEQIKILEQLVANPNTGGILFYAMDFSAAKPAVDEAAKNGIPLIIANTDSPYKSRDGFIGTDHAGMGLAAAEYAAKVLDCKGSVGTVGNNFVGAVPARMNNFLAHIKELCPDITTYDFATYDASAQGAINTVDAYLVAHPDLSLLYFADGAANNTIGTWKEKQANGLKTLFLGSDMPPAALEAVRDGVWVGSLGQDTQTEEAWGLRMLIDLANGKTVPDTVYPKAILVTKDNAQKYIDAQ